MNGELYVHMAFDPQCIEKKEKTTPFGINSMRSQVFYRAAQAQCMYTSLVISAQEHEA